METVTRSTPGCKTCGARGLGEERMQQFLQYIDRRSAVVLNSEGYRLLRLEGFTRTEVDRSVSTLRSHGRLVVRVEGWGLVIETPANEEASCLQ